ncbi:hypothetical protein AT483_15790 [Escherichia coli]
MSEKLKIVYRPLQELSPYAHNARTHSPEQVAQLVESIKQFGWTNPVLIDEKGEIIAGHGRVMAAEMLKMDSVPVIVLSGLTDEQKKAYRLADMIRIIKERFWLYDGNDYRKVREIYIYPDASGDSRKSSNASTTDIAQLKQAGFNVVVNSSNPPVKDRVNSMNAMFCNANGERRYKVNVKRCPLYAESLEQQVWDEKGEPDKKSGNDHPNDAGGYFIVKQFPIVKPTGRVTSLRI